CEEGVPAAGSETIPLRTPGQRANPTRVRLERANLRRIFDAFDHSNGPVVGADGQAGPVRAPRHRPDQLALGGQRVDGLAAGDLPDSGLAVQARRRQERSVRAPSERANQPELPDDSSPVMPLEARDLPTSHGIPNADLAVVSAGRESAAVRAPGHRGRPDDVPRQLARLLIANPGAELHAAVATAHRQVAVRPPR